MYEELCLSFSWRLILQWAVFWNRFNVVGRRFVTLYAALLYANKHCSTNFVCSYNDGVQCDLDWSCFFHFCCTDSSNAREECSGIFFWSKRNILEAFMTFTLSCKCFFVKMLATIEWCLRETSKNDFRRVACLDTLCLSCPICPNR